MPVSSQLYYNKVPLSLLHALHVLPTPHLYLQLPRPPLPALAPPLAVVDVHAPVDVLVPFDSLLE